LLVDDTDNFINNWILAQANPGPANSGRLLENGQKAEGAHEGAPVEHHEEEDGPWYFGKAKEEFYKRLSQGGNDRRGEEEDPIQVCGYF
jgi:SEL1 protein